MKMKNNNQKTATLTKKLELLSKLCWFCRKRSKIRYRDLPNFQSFIETFPPFFYKSTNPLSFIYCSIKFDLWGVPHYMHGVSSGLSRRAALECGMSHPPQATLVLCCSPSGSLCRLLEWDSWNDKCVQKVVVQGHSCWREVGSPEPEGAHSSS